MYPGHLAVVVFSLLGCLYSPESLVKSKFSRFSCTTKGRRSVSVIDPALTHTTDTNRLSLALTNKKHHILFYFSGGGVGGGQVGMKRG